MAEERIEIPQVLESVLRYCIKDAREHMEAGDEVVPFSALAVGETLFMERHNFETPDECFADARRTVEHARGAAAYGLCYDGYVETQLGTKDGILAQGGVPGEEYGHVIGLLYTVNDQGEYKFDEEPIYVGSCLNYMAGLVSDLEDDGEAEEVEEAEEAEEADAE